MVRRKFGPLALAASRHGRRRGASNNLPGSVLGRRLTEERDACNGTTEPIGMLDLEYLSHMFCPSQGFPPSSNSSDEPSGFGADRFDQKLVHAQPLRFKEHINTAIERDLIPGLMVTYALHEKQQDSKPGGHLRQKLAKQSPALDFERLAMQAVLEPVETLRERLDDLVQDGMPLTEVFLGLLAPAARHLGHLWTLDAIDFSSVTIGLMRLQQLVRSYGDAFTTPLQESAAQGRRVLLVPAPGEQHTFGLILVGHCLRRAGWQTTILPSFVRDEVVSGIKTHPYDVIGISVGSESYFDDVRGVLKNIRMAAGNRQPGILVGGVGINGEMEKVLYLGADATTTDGRHVAAEAAKLVDSRANIC